jgi:hypothetical protein
MPSIGWRIYAWAYIAMLSLAHLSIVRAGATAFDLLDIPLSLCAASGVLGFAYQWRIGSPVFWRWFLIPFVAWELTYNVVLGAWLGIAQHESYVRPMSTHPLATVVLVGLVAALALPSYMALFRYGYRSAELWQSHRTA